MCVAAKHKRSQTVLWK